jgi:hypothetical protein
MSAKCIFVLLITLAINFDAVELKNGPVVSLHLEIQAIAPPPAQSVNAITDLPYNGGKHVRADEHGVEPLTAQSKGVIAPPELILGIEASGKGRTPFIASRNQNILPRRMALPSTRRQTESRENLECLVVGCGFAVYRTLKSRKLVPGLSRAM